MAASDDTSITALLPGFEWADRREVALYDALWPRHDSDVGRIEDSVGEPNALRQCIGSLSADERWLDDIPQDSMDVDPQDGGDKASGVCFIDLNAHPALVFEDLHLEELYKKDRAALIVRDEYLLFMQHAISCLRGDQDGPHGRDFVRFFLTGQTGIGTTFGAYYILFYLLASGQPTFFIPSSTYAYFFSSSGVQIGKVEYRCHRALEEALRQSWVLIDVNYSDSEWLPPRVLNYARCVVLTSSPRERLMHYFSKHFYAKKWFMSAWSNKEIAAATERYNIPHEAIKKRFDTGGPVARELFMRTNTPTQQTLQKNLISGTFGGVKLSLDLEDDRGFKDWLFLIQPLVVIDQASGRAVFQRTDYRAEFLSTHIAEQIFELAGRQPERLQDQLGGFFGTNSTRSIVGRLVERMMHRALAKQDVRIPLNFGDDHIVGTLQLIGKATNFVSEPRLFHDRPLYLQPHSPNFGTLDAILVTEKKLGLFQTSREPAQSWDFAAMLQIIARLPEGASVAVDGFEEVLYCLVDTAQYPGYLKHLVAKGKETLRELQQLDEDELSAALGISEANAARDHRRLSTFSVVGYTFHYQRGFTAV